MEHQILLFVLLFISKLLPLLIVDDMSTVVRMSQYSDSNEIIPLPPYDARDQPRRTQRYKGHRRRGSRSNQLSAPHVAGNQRANVRWVDSQGNPLLQEQDRDDAYLIRRERMQSRGQGDLSSRPKERQTILTALENPVLGLNAGARPAFEINDKTHDKNNYYASYESPEIRGTFDDTKVPYKIDRRGSYEPSNLLAEDGAMGWGTLQDSLLPLVRQLVETNHQLCDILLKGSTFNQKPESKGKNREDDPLYDLFDVDLEKGNGIASLEHLPPVYLNAGIRDSEDGLSNKAHVPQEESVYPQPSVRGEAANDFPKALAVDQSSIPGCQWLVPYGTFLTPGTNRRASVRSNRNSGTSSESGSNHYSRVSETQRTENTVSLIEFYSTVFLSSEYLVQGVIEHERKARMDSVQGEPILCLTSELLS